MDCALWLNRRKIYTAAEIANISDDLDVASLRGYLLAGTLIEWLNEHGGKRYAVKLRKLSPDDEALNEKIAAVFGAKPAGFKTLNGGDIPSSAETPAAGPKMLSPLSSYPIGSAGSYNYAALSSFGSFFPNSFTFGVFSSANIGSFTVGSNISWEQWLSLLFGQGSFSFGSFSFGSFSFGSGGFSQWEWLYRLLFGYGSFSGGSFAFGSMHEWEWEWLYRLMFGYGSFSANSFTLGSFSGWEWLYQMLFGYGSFAFGSFSQWEWLYKLLFGYGSFSANSFSFGGFGGSGGFGGITPPLPRLDEYDLILLKTLADCPLDRFGYGIHNI